MPTEKKLLPSTLIKQVARKHAKDKEAEQGCKVGRKQMKRLKEDLITELLPRAFSPHRDVFVWLDLENRWLVVDAASDAVGDEVMGCQNLYCVSGSTHIYETSTCVDHDWLVG